MINLEFFLRFFCKSGPLEIKGKSAVNFVPDARNSVVLLHRRTCRTYLYNGCLAWYDVVLTARSLKREIQTTGAKR